MCSAKVVGIHGANAPSQSEAKPLPEVILKLRDHAKESLRSLMIELFSNADDALYEMADKAESNAVQATYFEAMRELRLQRRNILIATVGAAVRSFNEFASHDGEAETASKVSDSESLSLVDKTEMEYEVAIEGMVQRLRSSSNDDLTTLKQRIEHLRGGRGIKDSDVVLSPEVLCEGFIKGCESLEADIKAKLIVFKLFERYVLSFIPSVYAELNAMLIEHGILPDLKVRAKTKAAARSASSSQASSPSSSEEVEAGEVAGGGFSLDDLRQLLHPSGVPSVGTRGSRSNAEGLVEIPRADILNTLSLFQQNGQESIANYLGANQALNFDALLSARLGGQTQGKVKSEVDADVINLVSMLFDFILDDRQLQPEMKAAISRLQIPILKVALIDKTFFAKGGHPARKLLNEIASSAIGWNAPKEGRRDRFREKLEAIIEAVSRDFKDDVKLFDSLLSDFTEFVDGERKRGELIEQRIRDSERGKAASEEAKLKAQEVINKALERRAMPDLGVEILRDAWSNVLVFRYLREGPESESWKSGVKLVQHFVWSLCPNPDEPEARAKLLKMIPAIVTKLRNGFAEISFDEVRAKDLFARLKDQHVLSLQALQQQIDLQETAESIEQTKATQPDALEEAQGQDEEVSELVRSTLDLDEDFKKLHNACEAANEKRKAEESANAQLPKKQEAIVLVEEVKPVVDETMGDDNPFMQQVERFVVGCWFEFAGEKSTERCKLAAIIKSTGKHIFVNRSGVKVCEKNRTELALDLKAGKLQVLNDGLLFDRALESIITNLRS